MSRRQARDQLGIEVIRKKIELLEEIKSCSYTAINFIRSNATAASK
jgi:hypothetical protein